MNIKLYRYIGLEDFVNLMVNNKDRFVRPASWEDKYEGYLFSYMETKEDVKLLVKKMDDYLCQGNYSAIVNNYFKMWHSKWHTYAYYWSKYAETDAMWRCYSYGNRAIRIRTDKTKLLEHTKTIFKGDQFKVYLEKVSYDLKDKATIDQQINQMKESKMINEAYFHKRTAFKHEGEYRLIVADNSTFSVEGFSAEMTKSKIEEIKKSNTKDDTIDKLSKEIIESRREWNKPEEDVRIEDAGNISEYIDGIMVHPLAPDWYVNIIRDICLMKNKIGRAHV